ncbi:MAG TPA: hypothetical protein VK666_24430 [Chryseolinea sp.]|nr:hypothetical protein [Chryseolinea sp.]
MENRMVEKDIHILYVTAESFPDGIVSAYEKLHKQVPASPERKFYGLSRPEKGQGTVYKAAVEVKSPDEAKKLKLDTMVIPKGNYIAETVYNYKKDVALIRKTFDKLLKQPNIDPQGYCVELYSPNDQDVTCMVRVVK